MTCQSAKKNLSILEEAKLIVINWHGRDKIHYLIISLIGDISNRWISKYNRKRIEVLGKLKKFTEEYDD